MELVTSVVGGKAPRDGATLSIAFHLQGDNTLAQVLHACHPARQTSTRKATDLDRMGNVYFSKFKPLLDRLQRMHTPGAKLSVYFVALHTE